MRENGNGVAELERGRREGKRRLQSIRAGRNESDVSLTPLHGGGIVVRRMESRPVDVHPLAQHSAATASELENAAKTLERSADALQGFPKSTRSSDSGVEKPAHVTSARRAENQ